MKLIKELLALSESKGTTYQVKIGNAAWEDMVFDHIDSLQQLADEIANDGRDGKAIVKALPELHAYLEEYHIGTHRLNNEVFDVIDEDYDIKSFKDDVLKISYKFTVRYGSKQESDKAVRAREQMNKKSSAWKDEYESDKKEPRTVKGEITFMPGN